MPIVRQFPQVQHQRLREFASVGSLIIVPTLKLEQKLLGQLPTGLRIDIFLLRQPGNIPNDRLEESGV